MSIKACIVTLLIYTIGAVLLIMFSNRVNNRLFSKSVNFECLPDPDHIKPWDASIKKFYIRRTPYIMCSFYPEPVTSTVNDHGILLITYYDNSITCFYTPFGRNGDFKRIYGFMTVAINNYPIDLVKLGHQFVRISCFSQNGYEVYRHAHFHPSFRANSKPVTKIKKKKQYSVFMLVIESLSRGNYNRYMTRTEKVLQQLNASNKTNLFDLKGLVKVADNSYPNMIPLLTGKAAYTSKEDSGRRLGPFDTMDIIWKKFKTQGYYTSFIEDHPKLNLFTYAARGFIMQPVDWYPRPYWQEVYPNVTSDIYCYKNWPRIVLFFDQCKRFLVRGQRDHVPTFTFSFYIEVTHGNFNKANMIDGYVAGFIKSFNHLDDTIVMVMGDHGYRFGKMAKTDIGYVESRMPYMSMLLPNSLVHEHPSIATNLKLNEKRLTTWYDLHQVLLDISNIEYERLPVSNETKLSYNVMREPIPLTRTCKEARIPDAYCLCNKRNDIGNKSSEANEAAAALVKGLNILNSIEGNKCAQLKLDTVISAKEILRLSRFANPNRTVEVLINVKPSGGEFQAKLDKPRNSLLFVLNSEITRLNEYGNQSDCTTLKRLKPYCFCIK